MPVVRKVWAPYTQMLRVETLVRQCGRGGVLAVVVCTNGAHPGCAGCAILALGGCGGMGDSSYDT